MMMMTGMVNYAPGWPLVENPQGSHRSCSACLVIPIPIIIIIIPVPIIINTILAVCLARINVLLYDPPIRKSNCDALVVQTHLEFFDMEGTEHR